MDIRAEYYMELNEELSVLSESAKCKSVLVRNKDTGELLVKKEMDFRTYEIYGKLKKLSHINLVNVVECFADSDKCIAFEEYVNGKRLDSIMASKRIQAQQAVQYVIQLCQGLRVIHENGIIHRDINPKNIIVTNDDVIKLIDFDIARKEKVGAKQDTELWGTVGYAAPEQYGFAQTDERSDVYSVGILLKAIITGSEQSTIEDVKRSLISFSNIISEKIIKVISKCTEIDPKNRYSSAEELSQELKAIFKEKNKKITEEYVEEDLPPITWKYVLKTIPGFRRGNIFFSICATVVYVFFIVIFGKIALMEPVNFLGKIYAMVGYQAFLILPYMYLTNIMHIAQRFPKQKF